MTVAVIIGAGAAAVDLVAEGLADQDAVTDSDCEHGFESAECTVEGLPHIRAHNSLVVGAPVKVVRGGKTTFEGEVAVIDDAVSPHAVECAGIYDEFTRREDYCAGFVEGRYDLAQEYPADIYRGVFSQQICSVLDLTTDGQVQFTLPKGSKVKINQGRAVYIRLLDGLAPGQSIDRVTGRWDCGGSGVLAAEVHAFTDPFTYAGEAIVCEGAVTVSDAARSGTFDSDDDVQVEGQGYTTIVVWCTSGNDVAETTGENFCQLRDLRVYVNRTTAPRPDQIIAEVAMGSGLCLASSTEALGAPVTQFMADPFGTRAATIETARALYSGIMDVGVWDDATVHVRARPTSPPQRSCWLALSLADLVDPQTGWGIVKDSEAGVDAICCSYGAIGVTGIPDGTPRSVYYPSNPTAADARVPVLELESATDAEALAAATQVYTYTSQLATGSVPLDAEHLTERYGQAAVPTVDGALLPIDHIRSWDWVMCVDAADADSRGPFQLSRVERSADGVTIEVGGDYWQHPGFTHAQKTGRYIGAHRTRSREAYAKWWRRTHKGKPLPRKHAKWHYGAWRDVEGRYAG